MKRYKILHRVIGVALVILFLTGCGAPSIATPMEVPTGTTIPDTPTLMPTLAPTPVPTLVPTAVDVPLPALPPADATITFDQGLCAYEGPQTIPAGKNFTVNWLVKNKDYENYAILVVNLDEGKTETDLWNAKNSGSPPAWVTVVNTFEAQAHSSKQVVVENVVAPLYFTCWHSQSPPTMFRILGPIAVTGTTP